MTTSRDEREALAKLRSIQRGVEMPVNLVLLDGLLADANRAEELQRDLELCERGNEVDAKDYERQLQAEREAHATAWWKSFATLWDVLDDIIALEIDKGMQEDLADDFASDLAAEQCRAGRMVEARDQSWAERNAILAELTAEREAHAKTKTVLQVEHSNAEAFLEELAAERTRSAGLERELACDAPIGEPCRLLGSTCRDCLAFGLAQKVAGLERELEEAFHELGSIDEDRGRYATSNTALLGKVRALESTRDELIAAGGQVADCVRVLAFAKSRYPDIFSDPRAADMIDAVSESVTEMDAAIARAKSSEPK